MTYQPNVLLLDQDPVLRRATALLLCNRGALVSPAATLEEAISLSRQRVYDVALIDLDPGTRSAREILGRLRREGTMPRRVVFCADEPISCDGADDLCEVLLKPYAFGRLLSSIFVELTPRPSARSGVFPRLRLVRDDLAEPERSTPAERGARIAGAAAVEDAAAVDVDVDVDTGIHGVIPLGGDAVDLGVAAVAARGRGVVEARGAVVRLQRRTRSGPSGRTLRSPRRAPRGARHHG
jgi:CheY-like chemotaxis protein